MRCGRVQVWSRSRPHSGAQYANLGTAYQVLATGNGRCSSRRHLVKRDARLPLQHPSQPPRILEQQQRMSLRVEEQSVLRWSTKPGTG